MTGSPMNDFRLHTPVLVIGSGIAGCTTALTLADLGHEVTLITTGPQLEGGNSPLAQGGIVFRADDGDPRLLEHDIMVAGHHHNYLKAVRHISRNGPDAVRDILVDRLRVGAIRSASGI